VARALIRATRTGAGRDPVAYVFLGVLVGGAYAAGVMVALLWPGDTPVSLPVWLLAFIGAFPAFGAGLISFKVARGRTAAPGWRRTFPPPRAPAPARSAALPRWLVLGAPAVLAAVAVTMLVLAVTAGPPPPGQPIVTDDGRYALNNHGVLTYVGYDEWVRALELGQRLFVGLALVFYTVAAFAVAAAIGLRTPRPRPQGTQPT